MQEDYGIEFEELGACVEFLDSALRNLKMLNMERSNFDEIYVNERSAGNATFTVVLRGAAETSVSLLRKLARSPGQETKETRPIGKPLTINQLLERVMLARQPDMPAETGLAILLFNATDEDFRQRYTQLLDMGCREVRVGLLNKSAENQGVSHLLRVGKPAKSFWPPSEWGEQEDSQCRAIAFHRIRADDECKVYVEWGYEHPVERFERLYDFGHPQCDSIYVCNGPADAQIRERLVRLEREINELRAAGKNHAAEKLAAEARELKRPQWFALLEKDVGDLFNLTEQALRLESVEQAPPVTLKPLEQARECLLHFRVQRDGRSTSSSLDLLENQIAQHQKAIEELQQDYRAAHALRREPIYLAYVFEQTLDHEDGLGPELSPTFVRFLDQPFSQLRHMTYGFYENPATNGLRTGLHVVFDSRPGSYMQVLTTLAHDIYIQRENWREWNLPLYVRRGDDPRPRLEEQELEPVVRDLLWNSQNHPYHEPVLLRALPKGRADDGEPSWQAFYVRDTIPVTDSRCFRFLNERFAAPVLTFRAEVPRELEAKLEDCQVRLTERSTELDVQIVDAVRKRIDHAEEEWRHVDDRIDEVAKQTAEHEQAVSLAQAAVLSFPGDWAKFVERVLTANRDLLDPKLTAVKAYREARRELAQLEEAYETGLLDVKRQVQLDIEAVARRRAALTAVQQEADRLLGQLSKDATAVHTYQQQVQARIRELRAQADQQLAELGATLNDARNDQAAMQGKIQQVKGDREAIRRQQGLNDQLRRDQEKEERDLAAETETLNRNLDELRRRRQSLNDQRENLKSLQAQYQEDARKLDADTLAVEQEVTRYQTELTQLKGGFRIIDDRRGAMRKLRDRTISLTNTIQSHPTIEFNQNLPDPTQLRVAGKLSPELLKDLRDGLGRGGS